MICCKGSRWPRRLMSSRKASTSAGVSARSKFEVQPHARLLEQVRQQQFRLQPGRIDSLLGQELRAALNGFQDRHADKGKRCGRRSKPKLMWVI